MAQHDQTDWQGMAQRYRRDGYVVIRQAFSPQEVRAFRDEASALCSGHRGQVLGAEAVAAAAATDRDALASVLAIHFPHKASELLKQTLFNDAIVALLREVIGPDIKCMQSMLFVKHAGKPGQAWHQDEHYIPTRDRSLVGVWIALDDAREDNGGLWMHPGSHEAGILWPTREHQDKRFDASAEAFDFPYAREGGVPVDADAGDVVVFHGYVLHRSLNNRRQQGFRRAIVNHVMSARLLLPWSFGMPPTPREDFRDVVMVSGEDPYAWKGYEDITKPFLRAEDPAQARTIYRQLTGRKESPPA
ncbi:MAG: phytanoyl-CoA dioxygenase family protein [Pseudomonadota bacterium]